MSIRCRTPAVVVPTCRIALVVTDRPRTATSITDRPRLPVEITVEDESEQELFFDQYDGPFEFPNKAFKAVGPFGQRLYFTVETLSGENRVHFSNSFLGISHDHLSGEIPNNLPPIDGVQASQWHGATIYDKETDSYNNGEFVVILESGTIPSGVNNVRNARDDHTIFGTINFDNLLQTAREYGLTFASRSYTQGSTNEGTYRRAWFSNTPGPAVGGFFAGGPLGMVWVDGYLLVILYSDPLRVQDLAIEIARTGTAARTQNVTSFDDDTNTYTGTHSRARKLLVIPAGKTKVTAEFKMLVTPEVGNPYFIFITQDYNVTPETTEELIFEFPWIPNATVYYFSATFNFTQSVYVGFSNFEIALEYDRLPTSTGWPLGVTFSTSARTTDAWDDFEDYDPNSGVDYGQELVQLSTGYGWTDKYEFMSFDFEDAYDDFENYEIGDRNVFNNGVGWLLPGGLLFIPVNEAVDDFESYTVGAINTLNFLEPEWTENGAFYGPADVDATDDFESYAMGAITILDFAGTYWAADGDFYP